LENYKNSKKKKLPNTLTVEDIFPYLNYICGCTPNMNQKYINIFDEELDIIFF